MKKNTNFRLLECLDPDQFQYLENWFKGEGEMRAVPIEETEIRQSLINMGILWIKEMNHITGGIIYGPTILGFLILEKIHPKNPLVKEALQKIHLSITLDFS